MPLRRMAVASAVITLAAAACTGVPSDAGGNDRTPVPARNAAHAPLLPTDASALPGFDFETFQRLLAQLKGTPVVVNVWAAWCGPCRAEAPDLASASRSYGSRVQFVGVDILDTRSSARGFMAEYGWSYPSVFDPTAEIRDRLGFVGQPDTVFYDADGRIAMTWPGPLTPAVLAKGIDRILPSGQAR
ncbi:MAG TPA: TlpA disulfide reductase family protein [Actinomycetota bacterium]